MLLKLYVLPYPNEGIVSEGNINRMPSTSIFVSFPSPFAVLTLDRGGRRRRRWWWCEVGKKTKAADHFLALCNHPSCAMNILLPSPQPLLHATCDPMIHRRLGVSVYLYLADSNLANPLLRKLGSIYPRFIFASSLLPVKCSFIRLVPNVCVNVGSC